MNIWLALVPSLIGLIGVVAGILLSEFVRRRQRAEQFASTIFARRLDAYEALLQLLDEGGEIADRVVVDESLSAPARKELIGSAILPIAKFCDRNRLFIDEELGAHCTALFMGVEDLQSLPASEREAEISAHQHGRRDTLRMIREDSGVARIDKLFRSINRPRITSPVIERIRELRRERGK